MDLKSVKKTVWAGAFYCAYLPVTAFSAEDVDSGTGAPDLLIASLKMIAGLATLIGLFLLAAYLIRKYGPGGIRSFSDRDAIKLIASKPLGPKKFITLVQVGDKVLTLGVTETSITRLDRMEADEFFQAGTTPGAGGRQTDFAQRLEDLNRNPKIESGNQ